VAAAHKLATTATPTATFDEVHPMRITSLLLLLVCTTGCSFFGSIVHGGTVATSAAAGAAIAGVPGAAIGGIIGFYGGDLAAEQVTGTRSVRVDAAGKVVSGVPRLDLPNLSPQIGSMNNILLILGAIAFIYFGGLGWLKSKMNKVNDDRVGHKQRTSQLEEDHARLRKEVDELWDKVTTK